MCRGIRLKEKPYAPACMAWRKMWAIRRISSAVAHENSGHTMPTGTRQQWIPGDLRVVMGMDVDEAGGEHQTIGIDFPPGCSSYLSCGSDLSPGDRDRAAVGRCPGSVTNFGVL